MSRFVDTRRILRQFGIRLAGSEHWVAWIDRLTRIDRLGDICVAAGVTRANKDVAQQIRDVFARAGIEYEHREVGSDAADSRSGPLVLYCNHPFGIADALIALEYALSRRPDTKVLANSMLDTFDINDDRLIWIDLLANRSGRPGNERALREAMKHLRGGGALLVFPSGVCSYLHLWPVKITDPAWSNHLARLIVSSNAAAVPIYFEGSNSWRFHALGLLHPFLRTLMLVREFVGLRGRRLVARVGPHIACVELRSIGSIEGMTQYLRDTVYSLAGARGRGDGRVRSDEVKETSASELPDAT